MHIAHFVHRYPPALGGAEAYFERLGNYHAACGDAVTVWTTTAIDLRAFWERGHSEVPTFCPEIARPGNPPVVRRYRPWRWPGRRYLLKLASLVPHPPWQCRTLPCNPFVPGMERDAERYEGPLDAVHAVAFPFAYPILCGLRLARRRGVPFCLTPFLHLGDGSNPQDRTRRQYTSRPLRWLLNQADAVFVQTHLEEETVAELGVPASKIVHQGLGVDPGECTGGDRSRAREAWGIRPDEVVVGHLANASVEKGTVDLLRAAETATASGCRLRVVLAGPEMANFQRFWTRFESKPLVVQLGVLTPEAKRDFYAGIDLFALPSRTDSFGLVLLEAWANGKPNVVYRAGGPGELVQHEEDGLQTPCGDWRGLADQIRRLVEDATLRLRLGTRGQARLNEFRWDDRLALVRVHILSMKRAGQSAGSFAFSSTAS